ncbi:MAG TPA: NUDIX domain-containing protein [Candidatus Paceibacterota bacterium]
MTLQVGVKVLLRNPEGKILLLKRCEEKYGKTNGAWDIVGGRIDPGFTLLDNLKREVTEETNLSITSEPRLIAAQDIIPNDERHIVRLTYVAETVGEPELDTTENTEYKWLTFSELVQHTDLDIYVSTLVKDGLIQENSWD